MPVSKKEVGECPVDAMMRVMDGRWKGTILWRLQDGPRRTSELKRSIPSGIFRNLLPMASSKETTRKRFRLAFTIHSPHMDGRSPQWSK